VGKDELRLAMRRARRAIPVGERDLRSKLICSRVLSLPELAEAKIVLAFSSFGSEVATGDLVSSLQAAGVSVLLPVLEAAGAPGHRSVRGEAGRAGEILAAEYLPGDELVATSYGPLEPAVRRLVEPELIDVVIAPGLAFDRQGHRLGYGGGFYDRLLGRRRPAIVVGVAFAEQVVAAVPVSDGDVRVDVLVTDSEVIRCPGR